MRINWLREIVIPSTWIFNVVLLERENATEESNFEPWRHQIWVWPVRSIRRSFLKGFILLEPTKESDWMGSWKRWRIFAENLEFWNFMWFINIIEFFCISVQEIRFFEAFKPSVITLSLRRRKRVFKPSLIRCLRDFFHYFPVHCCETYVSIHLPHHWVVTTQRFQLKIRTQRRHNGLKIVQPYCVEVHLSLFTQCEVLVSLSLHYGNQMFAATE